MLGSGYGTGAEGQSDGISDICKGKKQHTKNM